MERKTYNIDVTDKPLGRVASQIATLLIGKRKSSYAPNIDGGDFVNVVNASKVKFTGKKFQQKLYRRHSQYPGGLKIKLLKELYAKNPTEVLHKAVYNMLPKNKLRPGMIKRLNISK